MFYTRVAIVAKFAIFIFIAKCMQSDAIVLLRNVHCTNVVGIMNIVEWMLLIS